MFAPTTRVLIVDDMLTMRKIVTKICRELGFNDTIEAADGNLAFEALANSNPPVGLVISDWNMPNCTGIELVKKIRADEKFKKLPFLMVTAEAEQSQVVEAVKAGVDNYVVKPFSAQILTDKLKAIYKKVNG